MHTYMSLRMGLAAGVVLCGVLGPAASASVPPEPLEIGTEPQFLFDRYVVDSYWAIKYKRQAMERVFHPAQKHPGNPVIQGGQPGFHWVRRDAATGRWQMWYQINVRIAKTVQDKGPWYQTGIAYAESDNGIDWRLPALDLIPWEGLQPNNVVLGRPDIEATAPCLLDVPEADRRGFPYLLLYRQSGRGQREGNGLRIAGSKDGIHWEDDQLIARLASDHPNTISYDPRLRQYVLFCRAKHIYRAWGETMLDTGESRRGVARLASPELWTDWMQQGQPQTILGPDEIDSQTYFNFFYGMPTCYRAGIYWGFLELFRMNDFIYTELATSRDGIHFDRFPGRPKLIEYGPEGAWDDEMIFGSPAWVEVGDEWWLYYSGWDGPHGTPERTGAIGLARIRKEGFISMHGPEGGGVVATRRIRWPGGGLVVNADARQGSLAVRISDEARRPLPGFDYPDCVPFSGDSVAAPIQWKSASIDSLAGRTIRLEFFLTNADLYTFRALGADAAGER